MRKESRPLPLDDFLSAISSFHSGVEGEQTPAKKRKREAEEDEEEPKKQSKLKEETQRKKKDGRKLGEWTKEESLYMKMKIVSMRDFKTAIGTFSSFSKK